jgi:hypothetical protein
VRMAHLTRRGACDVIHWKRLAVNEQASAKSSEVRQNACGLFWSPGGSSS